MKRFAFLLCLLGFSLPLAAAELPVDAGLTEVRDLGRLNGQALACSHSATASRIKKIMINSAPKSRRYGEAFEAATSEAFLAQTRADATMCQDVPALAAQVDAVEKRLQVAIPATAPL